MSRVAWVPPWPLPAIVRVCVSCPLVATSKVYSPGANVFFGNSILYSTSVTETFLLDAASASLADLPKVTTAPTIPTKSAPEITRNSQSQRAGNWGQRLGISIETISAYPAKIAPARPSPILWPVDSASRSTAATYHGVRGGHSVAAAPGPG